MKSSKNCVPTVQYKKKDAKIIQCTGDWIYSAKIQFNSQKNTENW